MNLPFSVERFLDVFKQYNLSIWPLQVVFYLLAVAAIILSLSKTKSAGRIVAFILAFFWFWMGIAYHLLYFATINKAAYIFAAIFVLQGGVFLAGGITDKISVRLQPDVFGITGCVLTLFALALYPLIGYALGHTYPASPTFGLPCPTTIFTFGILLWANKRVPVFVMVLPLVWSVIGFMAAFKLGIKEDAGLLVSGITAAVLIPVHNKLLAHKNIS